MCLTFDTYFFYLSCASAIHLISKNSSSVTNLMAEVLSNYYYLAVCYLGFHFVYKNKKIHLNNHISYTFNNTGGVI
jgi:hypothetical protein